MKFQKDPYAYAIAVGNRSKATKKGIQKNLERSCFNDTNGPKHTLINLKMSSFPLSCKHAFRVNKLCLSASPESEQSHLRLSRATYSSKMPPSDCESTGIPDSEVRRGRTVREAIETLESIRAMGRPGKREKSFSTSGSIAPYQAYSQSERGESEYIDEHIVVTNRRQFNWKDGPNAFPLVLSFESSHSIIIANSKWSILELKHKIQTEIHNVIGGTWLIGTLTVCWEQRGQTGKNETPAFFPTETIVGVENIRAVLELLKRKANDIIKVECWPGPRT